MKSEIVRTISQSTLIILCAMLGTQFAHAQSYEYEAYSTVDCGSEDIGPPPNFKKSEPVQPKPPKNKKRRKYAVAAAEKAINAGYDYIIVSPLTKKVAWDRKDFIERSGFGNSQFEKVNRRTNFRTVTRQNCLAIDDIAATHLMWDEQLPKKVLRADQNYELMDVREFLRSIDPSNTLISTPRTPKIFEQNYKRVGDRERLAAQYPVLAAVAACHTDLGPTSLSAFKRTPGSRDRDAEKQCLETYRDKAAAVNWVDFPLTVSDASSTLSTSGYVLNRPKTNPSFSTQNGLTADPSIWGAGWSDLSTQVGSSSGTFLFDSNRKVYLIASNALDETQIIDHAVFLSTGQNLQSNYSGLALTDVTAKYKGEFESKKRSLMSQREKEAERARRKDARKSGSSDRKIEYKERDIERAEKRLNEISEQNDEATIAQMKASMAAFPDAKFDEAALRTQLKSVRKANIAARREKLRQLKDELALMKSEQMATVSAPTQFTPDLAIDVRPSQSYGAENRTKGIYYAFETFQNVLIVSTSNLLPTSNCRDSFLLCADKLQAYNALGPRVGKPSFTEMSAPAGYKPYENR